MIALIPLTHILRKAEPTYKFSDDGERINHLLFMDDLKLYAMNEKGVDSLIQTVRVFSEDIGMEFGIEKCAVLVMKRGKVVKSEGIKLPDYKTIQGLKDGDSYKYLGILEADRIKHEEMKETVTKEYKRRVRKILETKLNGGNLVKAINTWAIPLLRYSAAFLDWRKSELQDLDRKTRKLLTMHNGLHPKSNVDRIYIPREEGGRGLISVEDCVESATLGLERYINDSDERLIKAARKISGGHNNETAVEYKIRKKNERKEQWREKVMHGQFVRQTEEILGNESWFWLKKGSLKRETESLIMAAQEQALATNLMKARIYQTQEDSKCRMCRKVDESINHMVSECPKLAQKEYKRRHDWVGKKIHWEVCKEEGFIVNEKWYEHVPEPVLENERCKILWDFTIQTDHVIEAKRPDMIVVEKRNKCCKIIDFAIPYDSRIEEKEVEKVVKYQDLARELKKLWKMKTMVIPIVIGTFGTVPKDLKKRLENIGIETKIDELQKSVILNTARILRKVLEV